MRSRSLAGTEPGDCAAALASAAETPGLTRNRAPAATASSICSTETIVPAPTTASGALLAIARIAASADGVRNVTSIA